ncbi:MAG TPA: hypothetical protein VGD65_01475 [Chryseosolibacter sp.]
MLKNLSCIGLICLLSLPCAAQKVTAHLQDTTHVSDSLKAKSQQLLQEKQQIEHKVLKNRAEVNALISEANAVNKNLTDTKALQKRIYSEKHIKLIQDSIAAATHVPVEQLKKLHGLSKKEVSGDQLLDAVNEKFPHLPESYSPEHLEDLEKLQTGENLSAIPELSDISNLKIPDAEALQLAALRGNLIDSKYLKVIDSMRSVTLQKEKLKLSEEEITSKSKVALIKQKPNLMQRSYFEGVLGILTGKEFTIYQASPALGFHFKDYFSLGLGPTLQLVAGDDKKIYAKAGLRTFTKIEFLKRQVYVQAEDAMNPYSGKAETLKLNQHNVYVGGGFLLSMKSKVTLNFNLMYQVNENKLTTSELSPLVFRLGISTIKIEK